MLSGVTGSPVILAEVVSSGNFAAATVSQKLNVVTFCMQAVDSLLIVLTTGYGLSVDLAPTGFEVTELSFTEFISSLDSLLILISENPTSLEIEVLAVSLAFSFPAVLTTEEEAEIAGKLDAVSESLAVLTSIQESIIVELEGIIHTCFLYSIH